MPRGSQEQPGLDCPSLHQVNTTALTHQMPAGRHAVTALPLPQNGHYPDVQNRGLTLPVPSVLGCFLSRILVRVACMPGCSCGLTFTAGDMPLCGCNTFYQVYLHCNSNGHLNYPQLRFTVNMPGKNIIAQVFCTYIYTFLTSIFPGIQRAHDRIFFSVHFFNRFCQTALESDYITVYPPPRSPQSSSYQHRVLLVFPTAATLMECGATSLVGICSSLQTNAIISNIW